MRRYVSLEESETVSMSPRSASLNPMPTVVCPRLEVAKQTLLYVQLQHYVFTSAFSSGRIGTTKKEILLSPLYSVTGEVERRG